MVAPELQRQIDVALAVVRSQGCSLKEPEAIQRRAEVDYLTRVINSMEPACKYNPATYRNLGELTHLKIHLSTLPLLDYLESVGLLNEVRTAVGRHLEYVARFFD